MRFAAGPKSKEKAVERVRRYRARQRAILAPNALTDALTKTEEVIAGHGKVGNVVCGHCGVLFRDIGKAQMHVKDCKARRETSKEQAKRGECCVDSGEEWHSTACLCACHYGAAPSWSITANGVGLEPHKHTDVSGQCALCGAESEQRVARGIQQGGGGHALKAANIPATVSVKPYKRPATKQLDTLSTRPTGS